MNLDCQSIRFGAPAQRAHDNNYLGANLTTFPAEVLLASTCADSYYSALACAAWILHTLPVQYPAKNHPYRVVSGDRNWHIETADWNLAGFFTVYRNLLAGIWGSFLRFIETGFRNWLAAFLGFFYDFSMMSMIFQDFFIIFP